MLISSLWDSGCRLITTLAAALDLDFENTNPDEKADWLAALIGPFNEAILACLDMV